MYSHTQGSTSSFPLHVFYGLQIYMSFPQYSMNLLISINRFTMFLWLNRNDRIWKNLSPIALILVVFLPILAVYDVFSSDAFFKYQQDIDGFVTNSSANMTPVLNRVVIFMLVCTLLSAVLNLGSLFYLSSVGIKLQKADRTLLYVSVFSFFIELFCFVDSLLISYFSKLPSSVAQVVIFLVPYCSDLLTMSPPWILCLFSSTMREKIKQMLSLESDANRAFSLSTRASQISMSAVSRIN